MKKKSTSHSAPARCSLGEGGFLNVRVLIGLFVLLAGVFLALLGFAQNQGRTNRITREEMTLIQAQGLNLPQPPACVAGQEMFNDVPASSPFCPFIEELARLGITGGCAPGLFCPRDPVTRQQMAVFLVRSIGPIAYAHVLQDGTVDLANSKNITQANVKRTAISAYCFSGLSFAFQSVIANPDYGDPTSGGQPGLESTVARGDPFGDCLLPPNPVPNTQVEVATSIQDSFAPAGFFVIFN
jgi:hypothetical protein